MMTGQLSIALVGAGLVGRELVEQLVRQAPVLRAEAAGVELRLVAVCSSRRMLVAPAGTDLLQQPPATTMSQMSASASATDLDALVAHVLAHGPRGVIVDCTASDAVAECYPRWLRQGVHVVTPNKKAFSGPLALFREIRALAAWAQCRHEATVGAGLPVLNTLSDLVRTGDTVLRVEGILSGTLSYLFNTFSDPGCTATFSQLVQQARDKGFTEPDPRDDLNGRDVGRKVVILGRCAGIDLDLDALRIENIVPAPLRELASADDFLARLPENDEHFARMRREALEREQVLRYVGVVAIDGSSCVELRRYARSHPFASLQGSTNVVAFTTARYPSPLIVQGAGAGAAVTAMGVFADLLRVAGA